MDRRLELHEVLCETLGSRYVYFQPPASVDMNYPAIVYSRKTIENIHANNSVYRQNDAYDLTVIYDDPDSVLPRQISLLPLCSHDRHYVADNLYHDTFTIYF